MKLSVDSESIYLLSKFYKSLQDLRNLIVNLYRIELDSD